MLAQAAQTAPAALTTFDAKSTSVVSRSELLRVGAIGEGHAARDRDLAKTELRQRSQDRYKHWGNTLEALREKKKRDRARRLMEIEAAQQTVDEEETKYLEREKREAIERANRLLYQETDRVKSFHGGLMLAAGMKERAAQITTKAAKREQQRQIDAMYHEMAEENRVKLIAREEAEEKDRKDKLRAAADMHRQQLADFRDRMHAERLEQIKQGERHKKLSQEAAREQEEIEVRRQQRMREGNLEYIRANDDQKRQKELRALEDAKEEEKIAKYAAEKEKQYQLRRDFEATRFQQKQATYQTLLQRQFEHLKAIKERDQARLDAQMAELAKKTEAREIADLERQQRLAEETKRSREGQIRRKQEARARQLEEGRVMAQQWREKNKAMAEAEVEQERRAVENAVQLQNFLREQVTSKAEQARAERERELQEAKDAAGARQREDEIFTQYAREHLDEFRDKGRTIVPLRLMMTNIEQRALRSHNPHAHR